MNLVVSYIETYMKYQRISTEELMKIKGFEKVSCQKAELIIPSHWPDSDPKDWR